MRRTKVGIVAFFLLFIAVISAFPAVSYAEEVNCYTLVTSLSELADGDKIILASHSGDKVYAASTRKYSHRISIEALEKDGVIYGTPAATKNDSSVFEFTLGVDNGYYSFYDGLYSGYLCAIATGTNNRMYTSATLKDSCLFDISMDADGACTPIAKDVSLNGKMVFMPESGTNNIFICTAASNNSQEKVYIYKYSGKGEPPAVEDSSEVINYLCTFESFNAEHYSDTETVKYYGTYSGMLADGFIYVFTLNDARGLNVNTKNISAGDIRVNGNEFAYSYSLSNTAVSEFTLPFTVYVRCTHESQAIKPTSTVMTMYDSAPVTNINVTFTAGEGGALSGETSLSVPVGTELSTLIFPEAIPNDGYKFTDWSQTSGVLTDNTTINASFAKKTYEVVFFDYNNQRIESQTVNHGEDATPPVAAEREGYNFIGWDAPYTNIDSDRDINPIYEIKTYNVVFYDHAGKVLDEQTVKHGEAPVVPNAPDREGLVFDGWNKTVGAITEDTEYHAQYSTKMISVDFITDGNGTLSGETTVSVPYGTELSSILFPIPVPNENTEFYSWSSIEGTLTEDIIITAYFNEKATLNKGDVDGDGDADALDASLVLQYDAALISFESTQFAAADINEDGFVDCFDALQILLYDAKILEKL